MPAPVLADHRAPVSLTAWIGIVILFVLFGLVVAVLTGLTPRGDDYEAKRAQNRMEKWKATREEADKNLHSYAWVDKGKGIARIPIDRAMELTLADLSQKKPAPADPIASASPAAPNVSVSPANAAESLATQTGAKAPSATPSAGPSASVTPKPTSISGNTSESRGQPAAAANPPGAKPGTQPGPATTPAAAPPPPSGQPAVSPSARPVQSPPGTPLPVAGNTPAP